jgi:hypothetical protein
VNSLRPWPTEHVIRHLPVRAGQDGLGLGAERGQLAGVSRVDGLLLAHPSDGSIEASASLGAMAQAMVGHGQEEQVEPSKPPCPDTRRVKRGITDKY